MHTIFGSIQAVAGYSRPVFDIPGHIWIIFGHVQRMPGYAGHMPRSWANANICKAYARHMAGKCRTHAGHMSKHMCVGICVACARAHVRQGPPSVSPVCARHMPSLCRAYAVHVLVMCPGICWAYPVYARHVSDICLSKCREYGTCPSMACHIFPSICPGICRHMPKHIPGHMPGMSPKNMPGMCPSMCQAYAQAHARHAPKRMLGTCTSNIGHMPCMCTYAWQQTNATSIPH